MPINFVGVGLMTWSPFTCGIAPVKPEDCLSISSHSSSKVVLLIISFTINAYYTSQYGEDLDSNSMKTQLSVALRRACCRHTKLLQNFLFYVTSNDHKIAHVQDI